MGGLYVITKSIIRLLLNIKYKVVNIIAEDNTNMILEDNNEYNK